MKETANSLRWYFFFVAGAGIFLEVLPVFIRNGLPVIFTALMVVRLFLLLGFVVAASRIHYFLLNAPRFVKAVIAANLAYGIAIYFAIGQYVSAYDAGKQIPNTLVGAVIGVYLWKNATRLAKELQDETAVKKIDEPLG